MVRKPRAIEILTPIENFLKRLDRCLKGNQTCIGCPWFPVGPLSYIFTEQTYLTAQLSLQIASAIESRGYCVEPDVRFGIGSYGWQQSLALFKPFDGDSIRPSTAYIGAANLLRLCVLIASADERIDPGELDVFRRAVENHVGLSQTDQRRLLILEQLLVQELSPSSPYAIAKIIKSIPQDERLTTGRLLVEVAIANNVIALKQRRILERFFEALEVLHETLEKFIGQTCLPPSDDAAQGSVTYRRKWTLKDWREGHPGDVINDFTLAGKNWNFTDWKALNVRWRVLHGQFSGQQTTNSQTVSLREITIATPRVIKSLRHLGGKPAETKLSKLTVEAIRARTKTGDTPLHRAAKVGRIYEVPKHLLRTELFLVKNCDSQNTPHRTPLHVAAMYGHLDQVPLEFLTEETLSVLDKYDRTPLHEAAASGHADRIPIDVLKPKLLSIPEKLYGNTVLHYLAYRNQLSLLPSACITLQMLSLENFNGETPQRILENLSDYHAWLKTLRKEPATEQQKEKLRLAGYIWQGEITNGKASDVLTQRATR